MGAHTENEVLIHAPFDLVWRMTNDVASWPSLFSEYAKAEILHQDGDYTRFRLALYPDDQGKVWEWVSERIADRDRGMAVAHRVETGPFEYMILRWFYEDGPNGVQMRWVQDFSMRPDAPVDDDWMAKRINTNSPVQMALIRDKVEAAASAADGRARG